MAYKRYIKIGNKVYGPYEYHSYRDKNGSVKSHYLRKVEKVKKENVELRKKLRFLELSASILLILVALFLIFYLTTFPITGRLGLELEKSYFFVNETLSGYVNLEFTEGEFYPADSIIKINFNGQIEELTLEEFIALSGEDSLEKKEENFYTTMDDKIEGHGEGYGLIGSKDIPVDVSFKLITMKEILGIEEAIENITEENITEPLEENITEIEEEPIEELEEPEEPIEEPEEPIEEPEEPIEEPEEPIEEPEELEEPEEPEEQPAEEPVETEIDIPDLTGAAVEEVRVIDGICTIEESFIYEIDEDEFAQLIPGSVISKNETLKDSVIKVINKKTEVEVTTSYAEKEYGYGSDFLRDKKIIGINLSKFNFTVYEPGTYKFDVNFVYSNISLASISTEVLFENITEMELMNITNITNITEINVTNVTNFTITFVDRKGEVKDIIEIEFDKSKEQLLNLKVAETNMIASIIEKQEEIKEEIIENNFTKGIIGLVIVQELLPETELNIVELSQDITIQIDYPTSEQEVMGIKTEIFALEPTNGLVLEESIITLEKVEENVTSILYCSKWDIGSFSCDNDWSTKNIGFLDNGTHISFNITSFSAYAGGKIMNVTNITNITEVYLEIWDETDYETKYPGDEVGFYANYRDQDGNQILSGCSIFFDDKEYSMLFIDPFYEYIKVFDSSGEFDYNLVCNVSEASDIVEIKEVEKIEVERGPNWDGYEKEEGIHTRIFYSTRVNIKDSDGNYYPIDDVVKIEKIKEHKFNVKWRDNEVDINIIGLGPNNLLSTKLYKHEKEIRYDYKFKINDSKFIPKVLIKSNKELELLEYGFRLEDIEFDFSEKAKEDFDVRILNEETGYRITGLAVEQNIKTKTGRVELVKDFSKKVGDFVIIDPVIKLTSGNDSADIHGSAPALPPSHELQMKWDISSIPDDSRIDDAKVCLYIIDKQGSPDNDANFSRVNNQTWDESIDATGYNNLEETNITKRYIWSSTTINTWSCINVAAAVSTDYNLDNQNTSFRIEDLDAVISSVGKINDLTYMRFGVEGFMTPGPFLDFASREYTETEGLKPYLNITYTDIVNPNIEFVSPTPGNGTTRSEDYIYVNVTTSDTSDHYAVLDWNYSLRGWWRFENNANDNSTYSNHGVVSGATYESSGKFGGAYNFDGSDDSVNISDATGIGLEGSEFTLTTWVKPKQLKNYGNAFEKFPSALTSGWGVITYANGKWDFQSRDSSGWSNINGGAAGSLVNGVWAFLTVTYNSTHVRTYTNTNLVSTVARSQIVDNALDLHIGCDAGYNRYFSGTIDEVQIYDRALSIKEIRASYNAGSYRLENNFTNLSNGEYKFRAYAIDISGNTNQTEERQVNVHLCGCNNGTYNYICGETITSSCTMNCDLNASGTCFTIGADDIIVDGDGYTINYSSSSTGYGINNSAGYDNITITNCTINQTNASVWSFGIVLNESDDSTVEYCNMTNGKAGILVMNSFNTTIQHNYGYKFDYGAATEWATCDPFNDTIPYKFYESGIWFVESSNGTIYNNSIYGDDSESGVMNHNGTEAGVTLCKSNYTNITANKIYYTDTFGFILSQSHYNDFFYNFINGSNTTGAHNTNDGIILGGPSGDVDAGACNNNNLSFNEFYDCSEWGLFLTGSNNNTIYNNTANSNTVGIRIGGTSSSNKVYDNIVNDNTDFGLGIEGNYNEVINITILSNNQKGIHISDASAPGYCHDNIIINAEIDSSAFGVYISADNLAGCQDNILKDSKITNSATKDIYASAGLEGTQTLNATFLNVSFNKTSIFFSPELESGALYIKWYVDVYVKNKLNQPIDQANVTAWDVNNTLTFTKLTNSSGYIERQNVTEFFENATGKYYYTNYSMNASKTSENYKEKSQEVNLTINKLVIFILNRPPTKPVLISPGNESHITDRTPLFNWTNAIDEDGDSIHYVLNLTCNKQFGNCDPLDNRFIENIAQSNYTPNDDEFLKNFWDTLEYYNWTIKAWDGEDYGPVSDEWRFNIDSLVAVSPINDTSNFGSMQPGTSNDTTDNNPWPVSIQNDGNCFVNMSIYATQLWDITPATNESYQYKFDFLESNSFNWSTSTISWANIPIGFTTPNVLNEFNWSWDDLNDSAELDIKLAPLSKEPPGDKNSIITLTGTFEDIAE
ncbi:MAG: right-handed parallel beta-helix repeat-containing protein [Candidatus Pacearchaeota archaeon]|nr:MAG: right-handed parallel beta-helix repeat-containing protein [Candidatus Pacearchaeota archaeon]